MNAKMPELRKAFEAAGFEDEKTVLSSDPYKAFRIPPSRKGVVTFLRATKGPVVMTLIEKTLGKAVTTRTWETVTKVAR